MSLDISALENAFVSLLEAQEEHRREPLNRFVHDAVVKRFEYTYELSHKILKRFLTMSEFSAESVAEMTFFGIIRMANQKGLLQGDVEHWSEYRKMRNMTSHTYDESKAKAVLDAVPEFISEIEYLLATLKHRIEKLDAGADGT